LTASSVLLDQWKSREPHFDFQMENHQVTPENSTGKELQSLGQEELEPLITFHFAYQVAFCSLWLLFLCMFAYAFKSHRPALVLPNLVMQIICLPLITTLAGMVLRF
jgi:hypothetical protein